MEIIVATVAVEKTYFNFESDYDYLVPEQFASSAKVGARVIVGFGRGNSPRAGFIVALRHSQADSKLKSISELLDEKPFLNQELVSLAIWMKDTTFTTTYDCLRAMMPRGLGLVKDATERMVRIGENGLENDVSLTKKQQSVVDLLLEVGSASVKETCLLAGVTENVLKTLEKKSIVSYFENIVYRTPVKSTIDAYDEEKIQLTDEQNNAYETIKKQIDENVFSTTLLYGVTGSGKTQVFLKCIDDVLNLGKNVIVLVPEISLTPQTMAIFQNRYGKEIAVFHSALSLGERSDEFKRVKEGKARIVVGTRSAIFAPLSNIGIIIIDEEQEHTYKSEMSPRYHARDVARYRCAFNKAPLLLASATPSIESFSNAMNGKYTLCRLNNRYGNAVLPQVTVVDMKSRDKEDGSHSISKELYEKLSKNLTEKHQSILLINRRGYNTFVACNSCGHVVTCPNCSISMTYHSTNNRLMCHYCGYSEPLRTTCPECGLDNVRYSGAGTQRIEEELRQTLPDARVLRMDADTTTAKFSHETKLKDFGDGKFDILLGTQMVAKGLDFPNVTLVGVVNADASIYNENFNANEKAFSLLTQVVGRSGRGEHSGLAVIQTINPENPVVQLAAQQDYDSFYDTEIMVRKVMTYPPYCDIFVVGFSGTNENTVSCCAASFFHDLVNLNSEVREKMIVLGPAPSKIAKINNKYRYRLILKCKKSKAIREMLHKLLVMNSKKKEFTHVSTYVDMNPDDLS